MMTKPNAIHRMIAANRTPRNDAGTEGHPQIRPSAAALRSAATKLKVERRQKDRTLIFADLHSSESAKISVNQCSKFFAPGEETKRE